MRENGLTETPRMNGARTESGLAWCHAIYALHAFSVLTGIFGAVSVIGAFLIGWPSIIAVILNYVKRGEVAGTWLESHFRWQIRTFWFAFLWVAIAFALAISVVGLVAALLVVGAVTVWLVYRVARGWLALHAGRPIDDEDD